MPCGRCGVARSRHERVTAVTRPDQTTPAALAQTPGWLFLVTLAGLGMIGPFSIDTIFPAFAQLGEQWGASEIALQQIISVYLLAFAAMSLFHGPLSDALGRRPVVIAGLVVYTAASIGCALSPNLTVLLAFRVLQGFSAGAGQIIGRAMVRDVFADAQAQRTMAHIAMIFGLAPALAPIVGGWVLIAGDWRGIFWFLVGLGVALLVLVIFWMPETHPAARRSAFSARGVAHNLAGIWRLPAGRRLAVTGMLHFGGVFLYITAAPLFVVNLLGRGEQDFWMLFVPLIGGMVAGSWVSGRLAGRLSGRRLASIGYLISVIAGLVNLGLAALPATHGLPWPVLMLPVLSFGVALSFPILTLAMLDLYPTLRGAAASVQSFVSTLANAVIAGLLAPLLGGALWLLAAGSLGLVTSAWMLWNRHLRLTGQQPPTTPDAPAFEPTDEF